MGNLHIFTDWNSRCPVSTIELPQLSPAFPRTSGTNSSWVPCETLMTPLPEAYSIRHMPKHAQLKEYGTRHGQWVFLEVQTHPSKECHNLVPSQTNARWLPSNCFVSWFPAPHFQVLFSLNFLSCVLSSQNTGCHLYSQTTRRFLRNCKSYVFWHYFECIGTGLIFKVEAYYTRCCLALSCTWSPSRKS